jgi:predicted unusual protein kinase regulating ubiquinone biosynthesis (AarF/ABC1/UbiB family)
MRDVESGRWKRLGRLGKLGAKAAGTKLMGKAGHKVLANALVRELGEMKGLPMKVGQLLSYMDGLVPDEQQDTYAEALAILRANAPAADNAGCLAILDEELGPRAEVFEAFDDTPISSASIGQVYTATFEGRPVCVKVQYPGIREATASDLQNVDAILGLTRRIMGDVDFEAIIENFKERLAEEFDYAREAEHQRRFADIYRGSEDILVPDVIDAACSDRVLTSSRIEGEAFEAFLATSTAAERDRAGLALFRFAFGSLLEHGLFHADPHPGNFFLRADGARVGVLDYGCVQPFPDDEVAAIARLLRAAMNGEDLGPSLVHALVLDVDDETLAVLADVTRMILAPIIEPQPFTFTRGFAKDISRHVVEQKLKLSTRFLTRRARFSARGEGLLFITRNLFGLASLWGQLEATGDFRAEVRAMLA